MLPQETLCIAYNSWDCKKLEDSEKLRAPVNQPTWKGVGHKALISTDDVRGHLWVRFRVLHNNPCNCLSLTECPGYTEHSCKSVGKITQVEREMDTGIAQTFHNRSERPLHIWEGRRAPSSTGSDHFWETAGEKVVLLPEATEQLLPE